MFLFPMLESIMILGMFVLKFAGISYMLLCKKKK